MKALTLTQPWATLVAIGAKTIETRSWQTFYHGPLAIHAAKGFPAWAREFADYDVTCRDVLYDAGIGRLNQPRPSTMLPIGAIVAVAHLGSVWRITERYIEGVNRCRAPGLELPPYEEHFGDYAPGRYAWLLHNVQQLATPIPCKGALGLWDVPADLEARLSVELAG